MTRRQRPLGELSVEDGEVVFELGRLGRFTTLRRRLSAPLASIASVRGVAPSEPLGTHLRLLGSGWPGYRAGFYWHPRLGRYFILRRRGREAVQIEFTGRRVRHWIVETHSAAETIARLGLRPSSPAPAGSPPGS